MKIKIDHFNEDSREKLLAKVKLVFPELKTQREDIDEISALNDSMYKGGTSRGRWDAQEGKWIPLVTDNKSNVGSTLLHRQVNTRAGMLGAIIASGRTLWEYQDKYVEGVPLAAETSAFEAGIMNAFARWWLKADGWDRKAPEFCTSVYKDSNIFAQIGMRYETRMVWVAEDVVAGERPNPETGEMEPIYEKKLKQVEQSIGIPTLSLPYPRNIYVDKYTAGMQDQDFAAHLSLSSKHLLMAEGDNLDQEAVRALDKNDLWDGSLGGEGKSDDADNTERSFDPTDATGTMLRWDFWIMCPIRNAEWYDEDEDDGTGEFEYKRYYCVGIGNSEDTLKLLKVTDEFDPDGEIPLCPVRALPADGDMFYHPTHGEVIRSMYCAECAIRNATIDNLGIRARPPISVELNSQGLIKDLTWKPDQKWFPERNDAIKIFEPPDITMQAQGLIDQLREETKLALATDQARLGEYAGARATKYEVQRVTGATDTTVALQNAYVIGQFLPWLATKLLSYTRKFVDADTIRRVVNAHLPQPVEGDKIGEYDIEVDIVGQYLDEQEKAAQAAEAMEIISSPANAQLLPPATRLALLKQFLEARKFNVARLDFEGWTKDSEANAMSRIQQMLVTGVLIPPQEGENVDVHLRVARAQYQRWAGLENSGDPRAQNVPVLEQYIQSLVQMKQGQEQQLAMMQQGMGQGGQEQMAEQMGGMM